MFFKLIQIKTYIGKHFTSTSCNSYTMFLRYRTPLTIIILELLDIFVLSRYVIVFKTNFSIFNPRQFNFESYKITLRTSLSSSQLLKGIFLSTSSYLINTSQLSDNLIFQPLNILWTSVLTF